MARRRWLPEQIIAEIRDLHAAGERLTAQNMRRLGYGGMVAATYREPTLGSWVAALRAAALTDCLATRRERKWTPERIVAEIKRRQARREGLAYADVKRNNQYLLRAARDPRNFGSWQRAVEAAGLDYRAVCRRPNAPTRQQDMSPTARSTTSRAKTGGRGDRA